MRLAPKDPPGRSSRKARGFEAEIGQLHAQGYSFEAIREALAEVGVHVSKSTVQREIARSTLMQSPAPPAVMHAPAAAPSASPAIDLRSGKHIAEAFVRDRITNPLLRAHCRDEDRRH